MQSHLLQAEQRFFLNKTYILPFFPTSLCGVLVFWCKPAAAFFSSSFSFSSRAVFSSPHLIISSYHHLIISSSHYLIIISSSHYLITSYISSSYHLIILSSYYLITSHISHHLIISSSRHLRASRKGCGAPGCRGGPRLLSVWQTQFLEPLERVAALFFA